MNSLSPSFLGKKEKYKNKYQFYIYMYIPQLQIWDMYILEGLSILDHFCHFHYDSAWGIFQIVVRTCKQCSRNFATVITFTAALDPSLPILEGYPWVNSGLLLMHSYNRNGVHININSCNNVTQQGRHDSGSVGTKRKRQILVGTNSPAVVVIGVFMHAKSIDRAMLYLINQGTSHRYNTFTTRQIFRSMFLFKFYLEPVTTSGSAVHFEWSSPIKDVIHWWNWLGKKKHLTCANWRSCCPGSCSWSSGWGAQPCPAADSGWSVERQTNLNSSGKDLGDLVLPSCGEESELDRETVDYVFQPYELSLQISAACRLPPHDCRVQFWWKGKLVNFVNEQTLTGNMHAL